MEESSGKYITIVGSDFNARTGEEGRIVVMEEGEEKGLKRSRDKKNNKEGRELIRGIEEVGWGMFNGSVKGDEEGE